MCELVGRFRAAVVLGTLNLIWTVVNTATWRVVVTGDYLWTAIGMVSVGCLYFCMFKRMQEAQRGLDMASYVTGGTIGPLLGIYMTQAHH